jgi:hypothetical protein
MRRQASPGAQAVVPHTHRPTKQITVPPLLPRHCSLSEQPQAPSVQLSPVSKP